MSEKQIRDILRDVCSDLDRHSRRVVRDGVRKIVLPAVLGAGLALSGCSDDDTVKKDSTVQQEVGLPDMTYMSPDAGPPDKGPDPKKDGAVDEAGKGDVGTPDTGPVPPYMAPEGGTLYMAPDAGVADTGPVPPYMAPEGGMLYMAPDGGPMPPYMAPPDKGTP